MWVDMLLRGIFWLILTWEVSHKDGGVECFSTIPILVKVGEHFNYNPRFEKDGKLSELSVYYVITVDT